MKITKILTFSKFKNSHENYENSQKLHCKGTAVGTGDQHMTGSS